MARIKSSIKDIRKSRKNKKRNLAVKTSLKKAVKEALALISAGSKKEAKDKVQSAVSVIDKAVENGILHKNTAARKKSRLVLKLNKLTKK